MDVPEHPVSNIDAINAVRKQAKTLDYNKIFFSSMMEGDTTESAHFHAAIAREILKGTSKN